MNSKILAVAVTAILTSASATVAAEEDGGFDSWSTYLSESIEDGFSKTVKALAAISYADTEPSSQIPNNTFLKRPTWLTQIDFRPDFHMIKDSWNFILKPRGTITWEQWEETNGSDRSASEDEWYVNEWLVRKQLTETTFISCGRENYQWGPSLLTSPSNPFSTDNGRLEPREEVRGFDLARAIWAISDRSTASVVANWGKGASDTTDFHDTYALKVDYLGDDYYEGVVFSKREEGSDRIGFYAGWTVSDAMLLYAEGMMQKGSDGLYPTPCANPLQACMAASREDSASRQGRLLAGSAYTLAVGPTLTTEYLYNSEGYSDEEAEAFYSLRQTASEAYLHNGSQHEFAARILGQTMDPIHGFLRKQYLLLQVREPEILDCIEITMSYVHNIDDNSRRLIANLDLAAWDHGVLFFNGLVHSGKSDTEYGSLQDYQVMLGLEFTL